MIYFDGLGTIIESIYLNDVINIKEKKFGSDNLCYVNPKSTKYLVGKTVVINTLEYPVEKIQELVNNDCDVITRVFYPDLPFLNLQPYILRLNPNIMWNGQTIDDFKDLDKLYIENQCHLNWESYILTFPKIKLNTCLDNFALVDSFGNLSVLGWALQQVGVNILSSKETKFCDLDIYKTKKLIP